MFLVSHLILHSISGSFIHFVIILFNYASISLLLLFIFSFFHSILHSISRSYFHSFMSLSSHLILYPLSRSYFHFLILSFDFTISFSFILSCSVFYLILYIRFLVRNFILLNSHLILQSLFSFILSCSVFI